MSSTMTIQSQNTETILSEPEVNNTDVFGLQLCSSPRRLVKSRTKTAGVVVEACSGTSAHAATWFNSALVRKKFYIFAGFSQ